MNSVGNHLRIDPENMEDIRFAVVLNGGISLAVWMGGVVNEINRLVRSRRTVSDSSKGGSSMVYEDLLDLVAVTARADVIASTSAGGVNGAVPAYAQAYGADLGRLGGAWAELGSFDALLRDPAQPDPESLFRGDDYFPPQLAPVFGELVPEDEREQRYVPPDRQSIDLIINAMLLHGTPKRCVDDFGTEIREFLITLPR